MKHLYAGAVVLALVAGIVFGTALCWAILNWLTNPTVAIIATAVILTAGFVAAIVDYLTERKQP